jgi:hypothetical protein
MMVRFQELPDDARLFIVAAADPLDADTRATLERAVEDHLAAWHAHGTPVHGGSELRYGQFLLIAADERATGVSGCSIDALYRVFKEVERRTGATLLDTARVWYRDRGGEVRSPTRAEFRGAVERGEVDGDTVVFDHTVSTVGGVRHGEWEKPLRRSWHAQAFRVPASG